MFALVMLLVAAILLNLPTSTPTTASTSLSNMMSSNYQIGVAAVAAASLISGVSSALLQKSLVTKPNRSSIFLSAELAIYGCVLMFVHILVSSWFSSSSDDNINVLSLFDHWTWLTLVPVTTSVSCFVLFVFNVYCFVLLFDCAYYVKVFLGILNKHSISFFLVCYFFATYNTKMIVLFNKIYIPCFTFTNAFCYIVVYL